MWKVALIVASDRAARGEREDTSGPAIQQTDRKQARL